MDIKLTLKSNNRTLEIGNTSYKLVNIDGIDSGSLELNTVSNAQFDGSVVVSKRIQNRPISITVDYKGTNSQEVERQNLISFFNPKNKGLLIVNYGEIERAIEYEIEGFNCKLNSVFDTVSFTVDLLCPQPYWRDILESKINIAMWRGMFHFPLIIPQNTGIIMGLREPSLIVNALNVGNVESGMIIEFKALGTLTNPSILNVETQEFIKINKSMMAGEVITVNTNVGAKKVIKNLNGIKTNILNLVNLDSTFLQLKVGDNLLRYNADTNLNNLEVSIYYNPFYLGV